jgi:hypothetical protein
MCVNTYEVVGCRFRGGLFVIIMNINGYQGEPMKYLLQIYQGDALDVWNQLSEADQKGVMADYMAIRETPGVTAGEQLAGPETATTVRQQDGKTVTTDGPFTETKEALGGYFLVEADNLDTAIELAARVPATRFGGAVEVRPIVEY